MSENLTRGNTSGKNLNITLTEEPKGDTRSSFNPNSTNNMNPGLANKALTARNKGSAAKRVILEMDFADEEES